MASARWTGLLLIAVLVGCGSQDSSEYRAVEVENPQPKPAEEGPTMVPTASSVTENTPPAAAQETPGPTEVTADSPASPPDAELAVSVSRPFAVPLPERIPSAAPEATTGPGMAIAAPGGIRLLIPDKSFSPEGPEKALRVTFDDIDLLKVLNMEPVPADVESHLPSWLMDLNGQQVRLRGWMFPPSRESGISRFMFVRDNGICCFGRRPKVYDKVAVSLKNGVTTNYIQGRPFDVIGVLSIEADVEDGEVMWLYALHDATVIDE